MAMLSNLKTYPMSLIWEIERPPYSIETRSSCFLLFGEEWQLKMESTWSTSFFEDEHRVHLCSRNGKSTISGTCHVIANTVTFGGSEQFSVRNPGGVILTFRISSNSSYYFTCLKWKIHCHFSCSIDPLKTTHLSTGSSATSSKTCPGIPPDLQRLSDDLSRLLDKEIMPDATLTCGGQTWRVHRSVLTVRSDVFAALFRSKVRLRKRVVESETGAVHVEDLEPTVLDSLLKYIYSGKMPVLSGENVSGLYEASDRYGLHGLRKLLSGWMAEHLTLEKCLGFLVVSDAHGDAELKDATVAFIAKHFTEIEKTVWAKFRKEHLHLVVEVLEHFAPAMKK